MLSQLGLIKFIIESLPLGTAGVSLYLTLHLTAQEHDQVSFRFQIQGHSTGEPFKAKR